MWRNYCRAVPRTPCNYRYSRLIQISMYMLTIDYFARPLNIGETQDSNQVIMGLSSDYVKRHKRWDWLGAANVRFGSEAASQFRASQFQGSGSASGHKESGAPLVI
jgi:hypothetical protein